MNSEIIARIEESFSAPMEGLSKLGLQALLKQLDATVQASTDLFMRQRDAVAELERRLKGGPSDGSLMERLEENTAGLEANVRAGDTDSPQQLLAKLMGELKAGQEEAPKPASKKRRSR
jgi:hypothetical protein